MRIAAYVTSTIASIREVVAGARTGDVAIEGVFSHPFWHKNGMCLCCVTYFHDLIKPDFDTSHLAEEQTGCANSPRDASADAPY